MIRRVEEQVELRRFVSVMGEPDPDLFAGIDPKRVSDSALPDVRRAVWDANDRAAISWVVVAFPTRGWAKQVFGEPDVARLWDAIRATVRLDEPDPTAAWEKHVAMLLGRAELMNERRFDAVRFRGREPT